MYSVYVCRYVYMCVYVYMYICIYIYTHIRIHICLFSCFMCCCCYLIICMWCCCVCCFIGLFVCSSCSTLGLSGADLHGIWKINDFVCEWQFVNAYVSWTISISIYIYIYIYIHICTNICVHIYIYIYESCDARDVRRLVCSWTRVGEHRFVHCCLWTLFRLTLEVLMLSLWTRTL